jgi:hypothetical protein
MTITLMLARRLALLELYRETSGADLLKLYL